MSSTSSCHNPQDETEEQRRLLETTGRFRLNFAPFHQLQETFSRTQIKRRLHESITFFTTKRKNCPSSDGQISSASQLLHLLRTFRSRRRLHLSCRSYWMQCFMTPGRAPFNKTYQLQMLGWNIFHQLDTWRSCLAAFRCEGCQSRLTVRLNDSRHSLTRRSRSKW
jgi:hypothetical protein